MEKEITLTQAKCSVWVGELIDEMSSKKEKKVAPKRRRGRPTKAEFSYPETMFTDAKIPKSVLKHVRDGTFPGSEVRCRKGAVPEYTEGGFYLMLKKLGLRKDDLKSPSERKWAMLTRTNMRNDYIVIGELADETGEVVTIRVGRSGNGNFLVGMCCPVRKDIDGRWFLDRKNPRAKGIW
jgi:hypothetical protein